MRRGRRGRVDLLDATTNGATAHQAGTVTRCLALRWHGRAVPLVWRGWTADEPGQHWDRAIPELSGLVAEHLPGVSARARQARERRGCIDGAAVGAARRKRGATWESDWDAALPTTVVAFAGPSPDEPWLLLTDLPAAPARCREYRHRTQDEALCRDLQSFGWQWQDRRLRRPDRVDRLLLVLALATLWIDALAQHVLRRDLRHLLEDRSRRCYSRFQLVLRWLRRCLVNDLHVPGSFCLPPDRQPLRKLS